MMTATRTTGEPLSAKGELTVHDVRIKDLGKCTHASPVADLLGQQAMHFVGEADKVLIDDRLSSLGTNRRLIAEMPAFELAGPRNRIFYKPETVRAARHRLRAPERLWHHRRARLPLRLRGHDPALRPQADGAEHDHNRRRPQARRWSTTWSAKAST
jgi:hypothetical protein